MSKITIIEGNSNDKDNVRAFIVKGEKGEKGDNGEITYSDVVDDLTTTSTNLPLSANQGKQLKDLIDTNEVIISKKPYYFNSIAEMKAYNLKVGDIVITNGYYTVNDGGGGTYKIIDDETLTDDGGSIFDIENGLKGILIVKNNIINVKQFGAIGDGVTDNKNSLQNAFNYGKDVYIDDGVYYSSSTVNIYSNTYINGKGTIKAEINVIGELGNNIEHTEITQNKITANYTFNVNDLLLVQYQNTEDNTLNKRQMVVTSTIDGKLSNDLCNYDSNYTVNLINSIENIEIKNITIEGTINIKYAKNIKIYNINLTNGKINISYSYNIDVLNSYLNLGNNNRIDVYRGSSNITIDNLILLGGNSNGDNASIKLNEVFYSKIDNCNFGNPNNNITGYTATFHAIMVDGNFAEDDFPNNPSQHINISNCFSARGYMGGTYFIAMAKNINLNNMQGYNLHIKKSDNVNINNSYITDFNNETDNNNLSVNNTQITNITTGNRSNIKYYNCKIDTFRLATGVHDVYLTNCIIDNFNNSNVQENSAYNIFIKNCEILNLCDIGGINKGLIDIISHCRVNINRLYNSIVNLLIVDNVTSSTLNINMQNSWYNKVFYHIVPSAIASGGVSFTSTNSNTNKIETINLTTSNNLNNAISQSILKNSTFPTDTTEQHYRGEIIYNTQPTSGGYIGWICVASGTPGTWKGFGLIET